MRKSRLTTLGGRRKRAWPVLFLGVVAAVLLVTVAVTDDGPMVRRTVAKTPDFESEHAQLSMMQFYVPAARADGTPAILVYFSDLDGDNQAGDGEAFLTREHAKPLVVTYLDEEPTGAAAYDIATGDEVGPGIRREVWAAISLDDGETWKQRNLSESALETSFALANGIPYPGDVTEQAHAVAGNQILAAWTSKYCAQGSPRYSLKDFDGDGIADSSLDFPGLEGVSLYEDLFGVAGHQRSIDYTTWMHHGTYPFAHIGEIPFSCVWTARGTVEYLPAGDGSDATTDVWGVRWRKPERLTSGRRDAYKLTIDGVEGAGFVIAWQEDPEGLRPGYGEGPGVGWSGATVNHKADIWYSYIGWDDFAPVENPATPSVPADDPDALDTNKPKVFVPMAMPVRVTDNEKCELVDNQPKTNALGEITMPWCYALDIGDGTEAGKGAPDGIGDLCPVSWTDHNADGLRQADEYSLVSTAVSRVVQWTNSLGMTMDICVSDDGRLLNGQTGSSRARLMTEGYTRADGTKSAWVALMYEETKGLGEGHTGEPALDIGKDVMYHTFDMFQPDLAAAGHMLNMPETDPTSDPEAPAFLPLLENDLAVALSLGPNQFNTSIGRRGSLMLQPTPRLVEAGYRAGMTTAILLYKSGADRQGGPSDIFMRRAALPAGFDPATDNPFAVEHLVCDEYDDSLSDGDYPAYPRTSYPFGLCVKGSTNLSSTSPLTFEALGNDDGVVVTAPSWHDPSWTSCSACHSNLTDDGYELPSHGITDRVLTWEQTADNLLDEDWTNKYEVAKGHRGFIDGDFVMVMYGWSPNWLATSHGHEPYNLLIRRSFDGGETWTTTPERAPYFGDGTTYDQVHGVGDRVWTETRTLGPGAFEPARNVSQITSSHETTLDPRYSPTNLGTQTDVSRILQPDGTYVELSSADALYDARDPSKFFAVYETGDASVVLTLGEADPWDLYASRATQWGDEWYTVDAFATGRGVWEQRWDWVENKQETRSGEASIAACPGGQFAWIVWNEWIQHETDVNGDGFEDVSESDPMFRRLWFDEPVELVANAGEYVADAGELVTLVGNAEYDGDSLTLSYVWDLDTDGIFETLGRSIDVVADGGMQGVALRVCNGLGRCDVDQGWINPRTGALRVWKVQTDLNPASAGALVALQARFTDPGIGALHTATIDWGDGTVEAATTTESDGRGSAFVAGSHAYLASGFHAVRVEVTSADGRTGVGHLRYQTVFDRGAGNVDAPDLEYLDPATGAKIGLDFNGRYAPGATVPEGKLKVNFGKRNAFLGTSFAYLVVAGDGRVYFRGKGVLGGEEGLDFLVTAESGKPDLVRVRIWRPNGAARQILYDTQPGAADDAPPTTPLAKGEVSIEVG
jgi:hypothetical protein